MTEKTSAFFEKVENDVALFSNSFLNHIKNLIKELESKDAKNQKLERELTDLKGKYDMLESAHANTLNELKKLKEEKRAIEKHGSDVVLTNTPKKYVEHPVDIQNICFSSLSVSNMSLQHLLEIIDLGIIKNKFSVVDMAIVTLTDTYIKPQLINDDEWIHIEEFITQYVDKQMKEKKYSVDALFQLFRQVVDQGRANLLEKLMLKSGRTIEKILFQVSTPQSIGNYGIWLLEIYFHTSLHEIAKGLIDRIKQTPLYPEFLDIKSSLNLLFISIYYDKQKSMYQDLYASKKINECSEVKCYRIYSTFCRDAVSEKLIGDSAEIRSLAQKFTLINHLIKDKIVNEMLINMQKAVVNKSALKVPVIIDTSIAITKHDDANLEEITEIYIIKKSQTICPKCSGYLSKSDIRLAYYGKKGKEVEGYVKHDVLYCPKCGEYFLDKIIMNQIQKVVGDKRIKTKGFRQPNVQVVPIPHKIADQVSKQEIRWPSTAVKETTHSSTRDAYVLQEKSELFRLGYKITGLSRNQRWAILQNKAIPTLGLERTVKIIANNIKLFKRQKNGAIKFHYAISEWEHDINRLKKEYRFR